MSLMRLVANVKAVEFKIIISTRGFNTSENRNWIAAQATNGGCSHLFFVDDDMVFDINVLCELLKHDKDIVGAVYMTKYEQQAPVVEYLDDKRPNELFKCAAIGTGCLLIKTDVFKRIPQTYREKDGQKSCGWFNYVWNDNGSVRMSHDWLFCKHARECGYEVWADPTIKVGHIGQKIF